MHMYISCWRLSHSVCTAFVMNWACQSKYKFTVELSKYQKQTIWSEWTVPHAMTSHCLGKLELCPWFEIRAASPFRSAATFCAEHTASDNVPIWKSVNFISQRRNVIKFASISLNLPFLFAFFAANLFEFTAAFVVFPIAKAQPAKFMSTLSARLKSKSTNNRWAKHRTTASVCDVATMRTDLPCDCSHHFSRSETCTLGILLCFSWCTERFHHCCPSSTFRSSCTKLDRDSRRCNWSRSWSRIGTCIFVDRPTVDWPLQPNRTTVRDTNAIDHWTSQSCLSSNAGTFDEHLYRKSFAWLYHHPQWCHTFRPDNWLTPHHHRP